MSGKLFVCLLAVIIVIGAVGCIRQDTTPVSISTSGTPSASSDPKPSNPSASNEPNNEITQTINPIDISPDDFWKSGAEFDVIGYMKAKGFTFRYAYIGIIREKRQEKRDELKVGDGELFGSATFNIKGSSGKWDEITLLEEASIYFKMGGSERSYTVVIDFGPEGPMAPKNLVDIGGGAKVDRRSLRLLFEVVTRYFSGFPGDDLGVVGDAEDLPISQIIRMNAPGTKPEAEILYQGK